MTTRKLSLQYAAKTVGSLANSAARDALEHRESVLCAHERQGCPTCCTYVVRFQIDAELTHVGVRLPAATCGLAAHQLGEQESGLPAASKQLKSRG